MNHVRRRMSIVTPLVFIALSGGGILISKGGDVRAQSAANPVNSVVLIDVGVNKDARDGGGEGAITVHDIETGMTLFRGRSYGGMGRLVAARDLSMIVAGSGEGCGWRPVEIPAKLSRRRRHVARDWWLAKWTLKMQHLM